MSNILVVTEHASGVFRKPTFEALSEARKLAYQTGGKVVALVMGAGLGDLTGIPAQYGADVVLASDDAALSVYHPDYYSALVKEAIASQSANLVLVPATTLGRDLAPRVAAKVKAGLASDCLSLSLDGEALVATRPMYAGKVIAKVKVTSAIKIATLRPNVFAIQGPDAGKTAEVISLPVPSVSSKMEVKEVKASTSTKIDLTEADVIVTGGRGMKDPGNFAMLEELATLLGGAVGATRAVVDAGWCPHSDQVGQTGKTVSPNLYFMLGASGSIQHWAGMSGSKCIVAVNKDPGAPIMEKADYSIVGDLFEVVPAMIAEVKKIRG